jgi:hypothetical protein
MSRIPKMSAPGVLALALLLLLIAPLSAKDVAGVLTSVDPYYHSVTLIGAFGDARTFRTRADTQVVIDGEKRSTGELRARDRVVLVYELEADEMVATVILATRE